MNELVQAEKVQADIEAVLGLGKKTSRLRRWRTPLLILTLAAAGAGAYMVWGPNGSQSAVRYVTEPVARGDLTVTVTATGTVQPTNQVEISSELSGIVRTVLVDYNSPVTLGQTLATLDTDKLKASADSSRARLTVAKAKVREAEANLVESKLQFERIQKLVEKKVSSGQQLESADAAFQRATAVLESAKGEVAATEGNLTLDATNLAKAEIKSPITGVVLARNVEPGQTVASSLQAPILFTIAEDLTKMEVQVDVDEADVGNVKDGQKATFTVDAYPHRQFTAEIRELRFGSEVVQGVVTYKAVLITDNSELLLRPGMTATAEIVVEKVSDAVTVPNAALRFAPPVERESRDQRNFLEKLIPGPRLRRPSSQNPKSKVADRKVWTLAGGQPQEVSVVTGPSDGKRTQIVKGTLEPGQNVIVDTATGAK